MNRTKISHIAIVFSLVGGVLNLLISVIRLPNFLWCLTSLSGLVTIIVAVCLYLAPRKRIIWGSIIFFYSNLGFIPFGVSNEQHLLPYGLVTLVLGVIAAAISICEN
jgi:hypothetical protein